MFSSKLEQLENNYAKVFTPSSPISTLSFLKGRDNLLDDIKIAHRRKGASIVLYGERGVGKTSIAKVVFSAIKGENFYYSASALDTFDDIMRAVLLHYGAAWSPESRESSNTNTRSLQPNLQVLAGELGNQNSTTAKDSILLPTSLTPQDIARRLKDKKVEGIIIFDDFERISKKSTRESFADLIKKFSDNEVPFTLMIVGVAENLVELLSGHISSERSIAQIVVPRLSNPEISKIVIDGMEKLNVEIETDIVDQITEFSANFPYYTHLLCEGCVIGLLKSVQSEKQKNFKIGVDELKFSIDYAIKNTLLSISQAYDNAVRSIRESDRYKYTLYAIASSPDEPVAYRDICEWVSGVTKRNDINISYQLKSLQKAELIQRVDTGFYKFKNPLLKAYVILRARADSPENEIVAIDAQLKYVRKKIQRVQQRVGSPQTEQNA